MSTFVELVREMREAQRRYFKERTQSALKEAKRLEEQVDAQAEFLHVNDPPPRQLSLDSDRNT